MDIKNVPQWILESTTAPTEQNNEVGEIVGGYISAFRKRGFSQAQIGSLMVTAFLIPQPEVEKRLDAILSCAAEGEEEAARNLCALVASKGQLFCADSNPCEIIEIIKTRFGKKAAFETILTFPEILSVWKNEAVRDAEEYKEEKQKAYRILNEVASVFPEI